MTDLKNKHYLITLTRKRKRYFALGQELGYSSDDLKRWAKAFYREEDTFNNLTVAELDQLIERLMVKKAKIEDMVIHEAQ